MAQLPDKCGSGNTAATALPTLLLRPGPSPPHRRSLGCLDAQCVLCEHNPHRRCSVNFAPKYLVNDVLKVGPRSWAHRAPGRPPTTTAAPQPAHGAHALGCRRAHLLPAWLFGDPASAGPVPQLAPLRPPCCRPSATPRSAWS
jgi:hypothetical protein